MSKPFILGLTGSIGTGKSTTAKIFSDFGCAIWDADAAVHRLYAKGGAAVAQMAKIHPEAVENGAVNRTALKAWISQDPTALPQIEALVHPLVAADRAAFIAASKAEIIVLDIPLLYENGSEKSMDAVAVVSVPFEVQKARVLARNTMDLATFETILAKQMPDAEKRRRADVVIPTVTLDETKEIVAGIVDRIQKGIFHA